MSRGTLKNMPQMKSGNVDFSKKQSYLDSVWRLPVYRFLGADYTYQEVKETELGLGLDLQGGMHVTLEVSPVEIVRGLSGNSKDAAFNAAVESAQERAKTSNDKFVDIFYVCMERKSRCQKAKHGFLQLQPTEVEFL
jgi:SecD/SecF fusion protein